MHHQEAWRLYREDPICGWRWGSTYVFRVQCGASYKTPECPLGIWTVESVWGPEKLTGEKLTGDRVTGGKKAHFTHTHLTAFRRRRPLDSWLQGKGGQKELLQGDKWAFRGIPGRCGSWYDISLGNFPSPCEESASSPHERRKCCL